MNLLKGFLGHENKSMKDLIMTADHTIGLVQMDSASLRWLKDQEGIRKLDWAGIFDIRSQFSPWLFSQVVFLFLGLGFGDVEDTITAYYKEDEPIFFTIGFSGFYVILSPLQDITPDRTLDHKREES